MTKNHIGHDVTFSSTERVFYNAEINEYNDDALLFVKKGWNVDTLEIEAYCYECDVTWVPTEQEVEYA